MHLKTLQIFITLLALNFGGALCAQEWLEDTCALKGHVQSYDYKTIAYYGSEKPEVVQKETYKYNQQGYLLHSTLDHVSFMGHLYDETLRVYDKAGIHCLNECELKGEDTLTCRYFIYDDFGKLQKMNCGNWANPWSTHYYSYNNQGLLATIEIKNHQSGDLQSKSYTYDASKRLIAYSDVSENISRHYFQKYDEKGRLLEKKLLDTNRTSKTYTTLDDDGNVLDEKHYDYHDVASTEDSYIAYFSYNEKGQIIEKITTDLDGNIRYKSDYTYNDYGDVKTRSTFSKKFNETLEYSYNYKYDSQGNWTKKVSTLDGKVDEEEMHVIRYFSDKKSKVLGKE